jgi:hypothetical protein
LARHRAQGCKLRTVKFDPVVVVGMLVFECF